MFRALLMLILLCMPAYAETLSGQIIGVSDGDTATLLTSGHKPIKIRLAQIDAPEREQAYGEQSKQSLSNLIYRKNVKVDVEDKDQYGRIVGKVMLGDLNVNLEQIKCGMAWFYIEFGRDALYREAEGHARSAKIGLWADAAPIPPWKWRYASHANTSQMRAVESKQNPQPTISVQKYRCDGRVYCSQMTSCQEATYFLKHCPNVKVDGNHDGIPCEKQWCN